MSRLEDWPERLELVLDEASAVPFEYGVSDCCLFAARAAEALTGRDIASRFAGKYEDLIGGLRLLRRETGCKGYVEFFDTLFERVDPVFAHRGDLACVTLATDADLKPRPVLFVVDHIWLISSTGERLPRARAEFAWRAA